MDTFRLISYCISHIFMMGFLLEFSRPQYTRRKTAMILSCSACGLIVVEMVQYLFLENSFVHLLGIILQIFLLQGSALLISERRDFRALFTGLISSNYVLPGSIASVYLYRLTGDLIPVLVMEVLIHLGILWILIRFLRPVYLVIQLEERDKWGIMCLIPSLMYVSAMGIDTALRSSTRVFTALLTMLFFLLTMYAFYHLLFRMIAKLHREQQILREREILQASIRALKREQTEIRETEHKIAVHIHDSRHLVRIMQEMMSEHNYEGVSQMLGKMQELTQVNQPVRYCDNTPVSGVMAYYAAETVKRNIALTVEMNLPEELRVNGWELAVVMGNLMDNAMEICETISDAARRSIRVTSRQVKRQFLIEICSSCDRCPEIYSGGGLLKSGYDDNSGMGLQSAVYFAAKNQAVFDCGAEDGAFFARILI